MRYRIQYTLSGQEWTNYKSTFTLGGARHAWWNAVQQEWSPYRMFRIYDTKTESVVY